MLTGSLVATVNGVVVGFVVGCDDGCSVFMTSPSGRILHLLEHPVKAQMLLTETILRRKSKVSDLKQGLSSEYQSNVVALRGEGVCSIAAYPSS